MWHKYFPTWLMKTKSILSKRGTLRLRQAVRDPFTSRFSFRQCHFLYNPILLANHYATLDWVATLGPWSSVLFLLNSLSFLPFPQCHHRLLKVAQSFRLGKCIHAYSLNFNHKVIDTFLNPRVSLVNSLIPLSTFFLLWKTIGFAVSRDHCLMHICISGSSGDKAKHSRYLMNKSL